MLGGRWVILAKACCSIQGNGDSILCYRLAHGAPDFTWFFLDCSLPTCVHQVALRQDDILQAVDKEKMSIKKKKVLWLWSHQPLQMPPSHGESDNSGWIKTGYWPWIVKMHIKGTTSMNPDSYIFSYVEKHKNHSLEMSSLVCVCVREREREISSNLWVLQYVCFFFFSPKTSI